MEGREAGRSARSHYALRLADVLRLEPGEREQARAALRAATADAGRWLAPGTPVSRLAEALAALLPGAERRDGADGVRVGDGPAA